MKRKLIILPGFILLVFAAKAQNIKLSQYDNAPLFYNPASAGNFNGKVRVGALYSNQKTDSARLNHSLLSVDYKKTTRYSGNWGAGISYCQSYHPDFLMSSRYLSATIARHIFADEDEHHMFSAGLQLAYAAANINADKTEYSEKISGGGFKVLDNSATKSAAYADVNIGGMYTYKNETVTLESGLAIYHLTAPTYTLNKVKVHQPRRLDLTVNSVISLNYNSELHLYGMLWREGFRDGARDAPIIEAVGGAMVETFTGETTALYYGLGTRSGHSVTPLAGFSLKNNSIRIKASYEIPVSKNVYDVNRAELSAVIIFSQKGDK